MVVHCYEKVVGQQKTWLRNKYAREIHAVSGCVSNTCTHVRMQCLTLGRYFLVKFSWTPKKYDVPTQILSQTPNSRSALKKYCTSKINSKIPTKQTEVFVFSWTYFQVKSWTGVISWTLGYSIPSRRSNLYNLNSRLVTSHAVLRTAVFSNGKQDAAEVRDWSIDPRHNNCGRAANNQSTHVTSSSHSALTSFRRVKICSTCSIHVAEVLLAHSLF